jgi:hypothetical protein
MIHFYTVWNFRDNMKYQFGWKCTQVTWKFLESLFGRISRVVLRNDSLSTNIEAEMPVET